MHIFFAILTSALIVMGLPVCHLIVQYTLFGVEMFSFHLLSYLYCLYLCLTTFCNIVSITRSIYFLRHLDAQLTNLFFWVSFASVSRNINLCSSLLLALAAFMPIPFTTVTFLIHLLIFISFECVSRSLNLYSTPGWGFTIVTVSNRAYVFVPCHADISNTHVHSFCISVSYNVHFHISPPQPSSHRHTVVLFMEQVMQRWGHWNTNVCSCRCWWCVWSGNLCTSLQPHQQPQRTKEVATMRVPSMTASGACLAWLSRSENSCA